MLNEIKEKKIRRQVNQYDGKLSKLKVIINHKQQTHFKMSGGNLNF